jgi:GT2 family glycosyltransferase
MSKKILYSVVIFKPSNLDYYLDDFINENRNADLLIINNDPDFIPRKYNEQTVIINNKTNIGFGKGFNQAIIFAKRNNFDYLCIFNQDVILTCGEIEKGKFYEEFTIVSPFHLNRDGSNEYYFNKCLEVSKQLEKIEEINKGVIETTFVNAACWIINIDKIILIGGFNPIFFMYGEDLNLCHRIQYWGLKIAIDPNISVIHDKLIADYEINLLKKMRVHASYILASTLDPNIPQSIWKISFDLIKTIGYRFIKLNWKISFINGYALLYIIFKGRHIHKSKKLQLLKGAFFND